MKPEMEPQVEMEGCPRCGRKTLYPLDKMKGRNALSRRDNKTYICPECGDDEAWFDYIMDQIDQRAELRGEAEQRRVEVAMAPQRMLERMWLVHGKPLNEITGKPWVPYMERMSDPRGVKEEDGEA